MQQSLETESVAVPERTQPRCWFCGVADNMTPFRRSERVLLLSEILPVRWRYCRKCARHFIATGKPRRAA